MWTETVCPNQRGEVCVTYFEIKTNFRKCQVHAACKMAESILIHSFNGRIAGLVTQKVHEYGLICTEHAGDTV